MTLCLSADFFFASSLFIAEKWESVKSCSPVLPRISVKRGQLLKELSLRFQWRLRVVVARCPLSTTISKRRYVQRKECIHSDFHTCFPRIGCRALFYFTYETDWLRKPDTQNNPHRSLAMDILEGEGTTSKNHTMMSCCTCHCRVIQ